jgi:hypothetical protein
LHCIALYCLPLGEEALCEAMAILDTLCNHQTALEILADEENIGAVMELVRKKSASSKVKVNCMHALDKLTRLPTGVAAFMHCNGIPELLTLIADYRGKLESEEFDETDLETLTVATKILLRLCKQSKAVIDTIVGAKGAETYVGVLGALTDVPVGRLRDMDSGEALDTKDCLFSRLAAKLISNMYQGRIGELVKPLQSSAAGELNEFTLSLLGSLAMDATSSQGIVSSGGIEILLAGCGGGNTGAGTGAGAGTGGSSGAGGGSSKGGTKVLEVSTRALSRLAGNVTNLEGLVSQGAVEGLVRSLSAAGRSHASTTDAILGLTLICSTGEHVDRVCAAGGLTAVLASLASAASSEQGDEATRREIIMPGQQFLEQIASANSDGGGGGVGVGARPSLLLSMGSRDIWAILAIIERYHSDVPLVTRSLRVLLAYVRANPQHGLLDDGSHVAVVPLLVALLAEHAMFNESELASASDAAVNLVDEVLCLLGALLLVAGGGGDRDRMGSGRRRDSVSVAAQARMLDQQKVWRGGEGRGGEG